MELTDNETRLILSALDAYTYWELGSTRGTLPVDSGYVLIEPGISFADYCEQYPEYADTVDEEEFDSYQAACALETKLRAALPTTEAHT